MVVVYNGEIYNFRELTPRAAARSATRFRTRSDTEVIVHAWEEWGEDCVAALPRHVRLRAVGPQARRRCSWRATGSASSRCTTRCLPDGMLVFGSELKALLAHPGLPREIDPLRGRGVLRLGYVPEPRTIFSGVVQAAAGRTTLT